MEVTVVVVRGSNDWFVRAFLFCVVVLSASVAAAQEQATSKAGEVIIEKAGAKTLVRGRLLDSGSDTVTVLVAGEQRAFRLDDVLSIKKQGDSLKNGALIGGLVGAAWCAIVCGQGLDSQGSLPLAVLANGGLGALIGAGIDAEHQGYTTVYRRPRQAQAAAPASPSLSIRWRF